MGPDKTKPEGVLADNTQKKRPEEGKAGSDPNSVTKAIGEAVIEVVLGVIEVIADGS